MPSRTTTSHAGPHTLAADQETIACLRAEGIYLHHIDINDEPGDKYTPAGVSVTPVWTGVDRPRSGGWLVKDRRMARRLAAAITAGVAAVPLGVRTDVNGKTFMDTDSRVLGRQMNADLRRLGY